MTTTHSNSANDQVLSNVESQGEEAAALQGGKTNEERKNDEKIGEKRKRANFISLKEFDKIASKKEQTKRRYKVE